MNGTITELVHQSIARSREATVSILGISDPGLRAHLINQLSDNIHSNESMLSSPLFEHTFGWEPSDKTLGQLQDNLLHSETISALADTNNQDYKFNRAIKPYKHQLNSWKALTDISPKSVVVTTGTGSGKTECFMVPILDDLISEYESFQKPLIGVRALFLYPLNALINSQRERLDAWTHQQGTNIRYCLYNGNTPQFESKIKKEQRLKPNEVMSRQLMRREPAPILMTNSTMLEYMLVRQDDEPIFQISKEMESLRWIVLDEAHTYLGSQAAEISLLLRRVVAAFGKQAHQIRFIATSATIAGEGANDALCRYLASLAGIPESQVTVITGKRAVPEVQHIPSTNPLTFEEIESIDKGQIASKSRYQALSNHPISYTIRNTILGSNAPQSLHDLMVATNDLTQGQTSIERQGKILRWIDLMTGTRTDGDSEPFMKLRTHLFQRMLHGLWTCIDPQCGYKTEQLDKWPFGNVYTKQRTHCDCESPVYEFGTCKDCTTPHIIAEDTRGKLRQTAPYVEDEFSLQDDNIETSVDEKPVNIRKEIQPLIIAPKSNEGYNALSFDINTATLGSLNGERELTIYQAIDTEACCCECGSTGKASGNFLRKAYLGSPFYVSNAVPTILEFCPDPKEGKNPAMLPGRGRKLITFTDSRQGTARMAVRMQQEAERSRLRGLVFETLRNTQMRNNSSTNSDSMSSQSIESLKTAILALEAANEIETAEQFKAQLKAAESDNTVARTVLSWADMVGELSSSNDIMYSILKYNVYTNPKLFTDNGGAKALADLLLLREYARRPKNQNSTETLGIVEIGYQGLNQLNRLPISWQETIAPNFIDGSSSPLSLSDWQDFLTVALDFFIRENTFLTMDREVQHWMGARFTPKSLLPPGSNDSGSSQIVAWPTCKEKGSQHRLVKILAAGSGMNLSNSLHRDRINQWLNTAWSELIRGSILQSNGEGYQISRQTITFQLPLKAQICPVTHKIIARTFRSITPYLPNKFEPKEFVCEPTELPTYTEFSPTGITTNKVMEIRHKLASNEQVSNLRKASLWTDISDRTIEGGFYYRTAEHSAQQASKRLESYENQFKTGEINVLNCSTTMEMGVDIGGISAVVMNNVPPHPANYLQRAGRAGRRSESLAISYTLCKSDPHNSRVFQDPKWPFTKRIPAPIVTLSAGPLIQRHVNAYFLAAFLRDYNTSHDDSTKLNTLWFYGGSDNQAERFVRWLNEQSFDDNTELDNILIGTALQSRSHTELCREAAMTISSLSESWKKEAFLIETRIKAAMEATYKKALELEKKRHESEYLLKDLSARAFLPGHGFPTDLVTLNTANIEDYSARQNSTVNMEREDNIFTYKAEPSRGLSTALREYAPGSTVVVDGRVYRSAGVKLQDYQQHGSSNLKFDLAWRCTNCGASGYSEYAYSTSGSVNCHECGSAINQTEKRKILRPIGFTTDFWEPTTNNVTSQAFMPIISPRVRVTGNQSSLPDSRCGFIRHGEDGHILFQSEGQFGTGYAVCLTCGRTESMLPNHQSPEPLRADRFHRPIGGINGSELAKSCSGESVISDVFLGYETKTHVFEWIPRSPIDGTWLSDSPQNRIAATTIAIALRDEIAEMLGIESTEMGFAYRQERDPETGVARLVIQVYDQVAGGAGFVLNALHDIVSIISGAVQRLTCPNQCESSCSHCLANKDSRVEFENINRLVALDWFEDSRYLEFLQLPPPFDSIKDARYFCQRPLTELLTNKYCNQIEHIYLTLSGPEENWTLNTTNIRKLLSDLSLGRDWKVSLLSNNEISSDLQREQLMLLSSLGIELCVGELSDLEVHPMLQAKLDTGKILTLATNDIADLNGLNWVTQDTRSTWIQSELIPLIPAQTVDTEYWYKDNATTVIEITSELNGSVSDFPDRLSSLLKTHASDWMTQLENDPVTSIRYEDRYLKSPWAALLLAGVFWVFKNNHELNHIDIVTHFREGYGQPRTLWENWESLDDYTAVLPKLFEAITKVPTNLELRNTVQDVSHRRILTLTLKSGKNLKCSFDQGMGYWSVHASDPQHRTFNFKGSINEQLQSFLNAWTNTDVSNFGTWPTHILLYESENT